MTVDCSSGTYIRSLAADLGTALGGCAHLGVLRRTRVGAFTLADAVPLDVLVTDPESHVVTPAAALRDMASVTVDAGTAALIANGRVLTDAEWAAPGGGPYAMVDATGRLLAVYEWSGARLKPTVVLPVAPPASGGGD